MYHVNNILQNNNTKMIIKMIYFGYLQIALVQAGLASTNPDVTMPVTPSFYMLVWK